MHWNELLNEKENAASKETKIPLALTYLQVSTKY